MLSKAQIEDAANRLYQAEKTQQQIRALTLSFDMDMEDAYAVQKTWVDRKLEDGEKVSYFTSHDNSDFEDLYSSDEEEKQNIKEKKKTKQFFKSK